MDPIVEALTDRLNALYDASTPDEQAVLDAFFAIVANADGGDVEGFGFGLASKEKDHQNENKLGNFEIQDLMSSYNQAQLLGSQLQNLSLIHI